MRALLIVNPKATSTSRGGRDVLRHALASDTKLEVVETSHRGHAIAAAEYAKGNGTELVVVHGGDGTVNEVVNGLLATGPGPDVPTLAVVPGGQANVFARALGLPSDPIEATARLLTSIEEGGRRRIGLGRAGERWFTFNAGLGYDADVIARVEQRRSKRASQLLYLQSGFANYLRESLGGRASLEVRLPGSEPVPDQRLVFVSNTDPWTYLGPRPVRLNPGASFETGLAVFATSRLGPIDITRTVTQAFLTKNGVAGRNFLRTDDVDWVRVSSRTPVRLQVDGDLVGERTEVRFESMPDALTVAV
ncbi:diacylglycerol/lipid kinase family protein [Sciscionella marina]|uniref:diacylglycerol/lipid kinase family protein n=1 Tax=Sciscionella marina TaxID=508770 RepID=UPI000369D9FA|nr:diacylglycerol kinase family protein [Sciscionella marina]